MIYIYILNNTKHQKLQYQSILMHFPLLNVNFKLEYFCASLLKKFVELE